MLHSIHSMSQLRNVVQFFTGSVGAWPSVTVWRQLVSGVTCHFVIVVSSLPAEKFHSWHLDTKAARAQLVRLSFANQLETSCRKKVGTDILITETSTVGVVRPWVGGVGIVHVPQYHKKIRHMPIPIHRGAHATTFGPVDTYVFLVLPRPPIPQLVL